DLNNDGKVDIAVATGATNKVSIFIGNGDGSFQTEATVTPDPVGPTVAVGAISMAMGSWIWQCSTLQPAVQDPSAFSSETGMEPFKRKWLMKPAVSRRLSSLRFQRRRQRRHRRGE